MFRTISIALTVTLPLVASAQSTDAIAERTEAAKSSYSASEQAFASSIQDWFDSQERRARTRGDRDSVVEIKARRDAYSKSGALPSDTPRVTLRRREAAKLKLKRDYSSIISDLTKAGRDADAAAAENELEFLLSGQAQLPLFNGRNLDGWRGLKNFWSVKDGVLRGTTRPSGIPSATYLVSEKQFADFELKCQVQLVGAKADGGFMFRGIVVDPVKMEMEGPQCDFSHMGWGRIILQRSKNNPIKPEVLERPDKRKVDAILKRGAFNDLHVKCVGKKVVVTINGKTIVDGIYPSLPEKGLLGWQLWPSGGNTYDILIKNVSFKELNQAG